MQSSWQRAPTGSRMPIRTSPRAKTPMAKPQTRRRLKRRIPSPPVSLQPNRRQAMTPRAEIETASDTAGRMQTGARRRCAATRTLVPRESLIRFVLDPGGVVVPDPKGDLPGRGLWLSADRDVINTACARNLFAKNFRTRVIIDGQLADSVESLLARRCLDLLGLARRCGQLAVGTAKAREALARDRGALLLVAGDASRGCTTAGIALGV